MTCGASAPGSCSSPGGRAATSRRGSATSRSAARFTARVARATASRAGARRSRRSCSTSASFAGVGNIYADEALWCARVHPLRPACELTRTSCRARPQGIRRALEAGHRPPGRDACAITEPPTAAAGSMQDEFRVYGREGEPCSAAATRSRRHARPAAAPGSARTASSEQPRLQLAWKRRRERSSTPSQGLGTTHDEDTAVQQRSHSRPSRLSQRPVGAGAGRRMRTVRSSTAAPEAPTPRDGTAFSVKAGEPLSFQLAAAPGSVIRSRRLPHASRSPCRPGGRRSPDAVCERGRRAHALVRRSERQPLCTAAKLSRLRPAGESGRASRRVSARRDQRQVTVRAGVRGCLGADSPSSRAKKRSVCANTRRKER